MIESILFFIGATFILKYGAPTKFIRDFFSRWVWGRNLFECALCIGTWVGIFSIPLFWNEIEWWKIPPISAIVSWFGDLVSQNLISLKNALDKNKE